MTDKPKIAFVDDEPALLEGLRRALRGKRDEWSMEFHTDPVTALEVLGTEAPAVAVLDINMPGLDGISLARELKAKSPRTRCMILSGCNEFEAAVQSLNEGNVFRYFVKPCDTDQLCSGIEEGLEEYNRTQPEVLPSAAISILGIAMIVLDATGKVEFTSDEGGRILAERDPLFLDSAGICRAVDKQGAMRLSEALGEAVGRDQPLALSVTSSDGERDLHLLLVGQSAEEAGTDAGHIFLFLSDSSRFPAPDADILTQMFGLTGSEAKLAAHLASGLSLDEAAAEAGLTKSTARTYLKNVFLKTGVTRQAELVRKLLLAISGYAPAGSA